ncbi:MAG: ribosomal-processing cysteine protease Prp [Oscillospiraceae bacterium]
MIIADFLVSKNNFLGFTVSGHSEYDDFGLDIVCAGVSSSVMLTINTVDEFFKCKNITKIAENLIHFKITENNPQSSLMIKSLFYHLKQLQEDYNDNIQVKITEV